MRVTMLDGLPVTMLNGFGCACNNLAGVEDYDIITVGGVKYTANTLLDRRLIAKINTPLFRSAELIKSNPKPFRIVKAGEQIGQVYSYLKSVGFSGKAALQYYDGANYTGTTYYTLNENNTIDTKFIKEQGGLTISEEIKKQQEAELKENSPIEYYFRKFGIPVLLTGGAIYLAATFGKEIIKGKLK